MTPTPAPSRTPAATPMMLDALGEIRLTHPMDLIAEILDSGTNSVTVTLTDPKAYGEGAFQAALVDLWRYERHLEAHANHLLKATAVADIARAIDSGRLAIFYQLQNSTPIQKDVDRVGVFYTLGLRSLQLTYNYQNYVGSGCRERCDGGLTVFGIELIERMNEIGMLVDTSHAGMTTMADAIRVSKAPITVSHTCCQAVHEHVRNTTDDNLRALADRGGVVGICQIRTFVTRETGDNLGRYIDHIDHAVKVAGIDHVCIGSDRDHRVIPDRQEEIDLLIEEEGAQFNPAEWPLYLTALNGPRRMEVVWHALVDRGYSEDQVEKILSQNLLRLYRDVLG
jgi:membrane dipeptidase